MVFWSIWRHEKYLLRLIDLYLDLFSLHFCSLRLRLRRQMRTNQIGKYQSAKWLGWHDCDRNIHNLLTLFLKDNSYLVWHRNSVSVREPKPTSNFGIGAQNFFSKLKLIFSNFLMLFWFSVRKWGVKHLKLNTDLQK